MPHSALHIDFNLVGYLRERRFVWTVESEKVQLLSWLAYVAILKAKIRANLVYLVSAYLKALTGVANTDEQSRLSLSHEFCKQKCTRKCSSVSWGNGERLSCRTIGRPCWEWELKDGNWKLSLEQERDGHSRWGLGGNINQEPKESERVYLGQEREMFCLKWTLGIVWSFQVYRLVLGAWHYGGHRSCYSAVFVSGRMVCKLEVQLPLQVDWEQGQGRSLSVCTWVSGGFDGPKNEENVSEKDSISRRDPWWETLQRASRISGVGSQFELSVIQFGNGWDQKCFRPPTLGYLCTHNGLLGMGLHQCGIHLLHTLRLCFFLSLLCCQMPLVRVLLYDLACVDAWSLI